jgi:hypothetical protein
MLSLDSSITAAQTTRKLWAPFVSFVAMATTYEWADYTGNIDNVTNDMFEFLGPKASLAVEQGDAIMMLTTAPGRTYKYKKMPDLANGMLHYTHARHMNSDIVVRPILTRVLHLVTQLLVDDPTMCFIEGRNPFSNELLATITTKTTASVASARALFKICLTSAGQLSNQQEVKFDIVPEPRGNTHLCNCIQMLPPPNFWDEHFIARAINKRPRSED